MDSSCGRCPYLIRRKWSSCLREPPAEPSAICLTADFVDYRDKLQSFDGLAAYSLTPFGFAKDPQSQSQMKYGFLVSGNFFRVMQTEPRLGRGFRPEEDQAPGRDAVVVLAHSFWETEFASDPAAIGRRVRLNGLDFTVIGVAPESFTGMDLFARPAFYVPAQMAPRCIDAIC